MRPKDVGLSQDLQFFNPKSATKGTPRVTYTTIYKCDNFSVRLDTEISLTGKKLLVL